jgi:glycosyltransferase involved in cell wall biosynthesis
LELNKAEQKFILITSSNFPEGGASATYLNLFCRGLKMNSCSIRVMLLKGFAFGTYSNKSLKKNVTNNGIPYTCLCSPIRPRNQFYKFCDDLYSLVNIIAFLFSLIKQRKTTTLLIYNNELQTNLPIYLLSKLLKLRVITFVPEFYDRSVFRGTIFRRLKWYGFLFNFRYLNKISDKLIVFSHFLREEYIKMGFNDENIYVQPNLTDFNYWYKKESEIKYSIGYSGTPSVKDGLYDLFCAISMLKTQNISISLLVIGDSMFGKSSLPDLKNECMRLGIQDIVTFTGLVDSSLVKEYLSECSILVITRPCIIQTKAGFPTKLGEYFAAHKPVLATNFGDIERYFDKEVDLVMAECGNPGSIAHKIKWMFENKNAIEIISQSGYKKAMGLLEYETSVKKILEFIN